MNWINCKDKLPEEDHEIYAKYKYNRPIAMHGHDLNDEYALCDYSDTKNYFWCPRSEI